MVAEKGRREGLGGLVTCMCQLCFRDFHARESVMDRFVHLGIAFGQDVTRACA